MSRSAFDAEVSLDLAVNLIPFAILVFFIGLFALYNPWGFSLLQSTVQFAILLTTALLLGFVTIYAARVIEGDDRTRHE